MKRPVLIAASILAIGVVTPLTAQTKKNVLTNPGFEESVTIGAPQAYQELVAEGARIPCGDGAKMPSGVWINPADEWNHHTADKEFEYVQGQPGQAVHEGQRAIRIVSIEDFSGTIVGSGADTSGADTTSKSGYYHDFGAIGVGGGGTAVPAHKPVPFSFWAKGQGQVRVTCYALDDKRKNLYEATAGVLKTVTPPVIEINGDTAWRKYEGTLEIVNDAVRYFALAICVKGNVSIDDIELIGE